jgi:hypothetical protein
MTIAQPNAGQFPPGVSGYPHGRESKAKRTARREALIRRWLAPHGGIDAITPAEHDLLHQAAELALRNVRARKAEDAVRIANLSKILAQVGLCNRDGQHVRTVEDAPPEYVPGNAAGEIKAALAEALAQGDK